MNRWLLILALLCAPAWAADVYVDGTWGGTESGTESEPYNTIAEGVTGAGDGGTVYIKASGTYAESVSVGAWTLTLTGYTSKNDDGGIAVIDDAGSSANGIVWTPNSDSLTLNNLQISNFTGAGVLLNSTNRGALICKNCIVIDNGGDGIDADASTANSYASVINTVLADNGGAGVDAGRSLFAHNSLAYGNTSSGFIGQNVLCYKSVAVNNGSMGFQANDSAGPQCIVSCVADSNSSHGFSFNGGNEIAIAFSASVRNGGYGFYSNGWFAGSSGCMYGSDTLANTSGSSTNIWNIGVSWVALSSDPWTAKYNSSTNATWEGQDYTIDTASDMFDALIPSGPSPHVDSYDTLGPKQINPAGSVIYPPRRHGN